MLLYSLECAFLLCQAQLLRFFILTTNPLGVYTKYRISLVCGITTRREIRLTFSLMKEIKDRLRFAGTSPEYTGGESKSGFFDGCFAIRVSKGSLEADQSRTRAPASAGQA